MKKFLLLSFILIISSTSLLAQAKVGTTGASFLDLAYSVKSKGMGNTSVSLLSHNSYIRNPGLLAFDSENDHYAIAPSWGNLPADVDLNIYTLSFKLAEHSYEKSRLFIGMALTQIELKTIYMTETTYQQGTIEGTGREFAANDYASALSAAVGIQGVVDFGFGFNSMWVREKYPDESASTAAFDFGFFLRHTIKSTSESDAVHQNWTWTLEPAFGLVWNHYGPDLTMIQTKYPLPKARTAGFSTALKLYNHKYFRDWIGFSITPAFDMEKFLNRSEQINKYGLEVGVYEAGYFRIGRINNIDLNISTYGVSLISSGIARLLAVSSHSTDYRPNSFRDILFNRLKLSFDFAMTDSDILSKTYYYGINLSFN